MNDIILPRQGGPDRQPSIVDVAKLAGVSRMTVSRVLNNPDGVAAQTRERVETAIRALRYTPNAGARELVTRSTGLVGVVVTAISNPYFSRTVRGLVNRLEPGGFQVVIGDSDFSVTREEQILRTFASRRPAGIVTMGTHHTPAARAILADMGVPIVETWDLSDDPIQYCIGFDNFAVGQMAAIHMMNGGCRNLRAAGGPVVRDQKRLRGFLAAVEARGGAYCEIVPIARGRDGETPPEAGRRVTREMLLADPSIDGLFFASDTFALAALVECRSRGRRVPEDIAVMGVSNNDFGLVSEPTLTTINVPDYDMGARAADVILQLIAGDGPVEPVQDLGCALVERHSTRPEVSPLRSGAPL